MGDNEKKAWRDEGLFAEEEMRSVEELIGEEGEMCGSGSGSGGSGGPF